MKYLTEELYKKMQLFQLPLEDGITLDDLAEAFDIEPDEFLLQELLARDEWYDKYLPEPLHSQLFDQHGEVSFQQAVYGGPDDGSGFGSHFTGRGIFVD